MLPCNAVVQELPDGEVEVVAIDPVASMAAVDNPQLKQMARQVGICCSKLSQAFELWEG
jgi:hypothetical protein